LRHDRGTLEELDEGVRQYVKIREDSQAPEAGDAWAALDALVSTIDAPDDWAKEHDHYLYGSAKRNQEMPE
jgi:hypothetical protein